MKKLLAVSSICLLILGSCLKTKNTNKCGFPDSTVIAPLSEQQALQDSLTAHGIQAILDSSGFYYTINQQGTGPFVSNLCSSIAVFYRGSFFNGNGFDSTSTGNPSVFQLGNVITRWQKGIPLVSKGGDITLYIPPSLAYGATPRTDQNGNVVIPANSYLVFRVVIADIQ